MNNSFAVIASFAWAIFGFLVLSLTIDRHRQDVFGKNTATLHKYYFPFLQLAGWAGLFLSLIGAVIYKGWAVGATAWVGVLAVVAFALMLLLSYKPAWAILSALLSLLIGTVSMCVSLVN